MKITQCAKYTSRKYMVQGICKIPCIQGITLSTTELEDCRECRRIRLCLKKQSGLLRAHLHKIQWLLLPQLMLPCNFETSL